jgi:hypothetical protein
MAGDTILAAFDPAASAALALGLAGLLATLRLMGGRARSEERVPVRVRENDRR